MARPFMIWGREEPGGGGSGEKRYIEIPDGKWVAAMTEPTTKYRGNEERTSVVGVELFSKGVVRYIMRDSDVARDYLVVADQPFGVVWVFGEYGLFHPARQIHKGELGRKPGVSRKPRFVQTPQKPRHPARAWCCMTELAGIVGIPCREVLKFYQRFSRLESIDRSFAVRPGVHCLMAAKEAELTNEPLSVLGLGTKDFDNIWVPASWAMTVLYLHQFGYVPPPLLPSQVAQPAVVASALAEVR